MPRLEAAGELPASLAGHSADRSRNLGRHLPFSNRLDIDQPLPVLRRKRPAVGSSFTGRLSGSLILVLSPVAGHRFEEAALLKFVFSRHEPADAAFQMSSASSIRHRFSSVHIENSTPRRWPMLSSGCDLGGGRFMSAVVSRFGLCGKFSGPVRVREPPRLTPRRAGCRPRP